MNKFLFGLCLILFPLLAMAADATTSALSFTPPPTDYSVMFLSNLFGIVDGVLHGTGSQIMGAIFTVFNAAVLALGGIVIMYTLLVGTMNTAHEGEMLGKKWSSIWIPVRSTMGLALLIPKASGYCLMQIFVMWVVVQGVGAADKVWAAALEYLNRGGSIIQANMTPPSVQKTSEGPTLNDTAPIATGAAAMLAGQVCMLGLQKQLEAQRNSFLAQENAGPCPSTSSSNNSPPANPNDPMVKFCTTPVPNFIATFDAIGVQSNTLPVAVPTECGAKPPDQISYAVDMPNFRDSSTIYSNLTGICGQIKWKSLTPIVPECRKPPPPTTVRGPSLPALGGGFVSVIGSSGKDIPLTSAQVNMAQSDTDLVNASRATAIQQMYMYYSTLAEVMVSNNPEIAKKTTASTTTTSDVPGIATVAFGVPFLESNTICTTSTSQCTTWGTDQGKSALFNGSEFWSGIADYNAVMAPTINLMNQDSFRNDINDLRGFITNANAQGWMSAGSYFFDLINLNNAAVKNAKNMDTNTGLEESTATPEKLLDVFSDSPCNASGDYGILCTLFSGRSERLSPVVNMIDNYSGTPKLDFPTIPITITTEVVPGPAASTVYGFITNAMILQLPGQPGIKAPAFNLPNINLSDDMPINLKLKRKRFPRGNMGIIKNAGRTLGNIFYNNLAVPVVNGLLGTVSVMVKDLVIACVYLPLYAMSTNFVDAVEILTKDPSQNPIVALAHMGIKYINDAANLWLQILVLTTASAGFLTPIVAMAMPLVLSWMSVMVVIGMATAYYVPFLPYMIFTFGVIAWLMAVIEAMVAAPIVALGITHPEGEGVMGSKGEQALMILMNVFLRPALMIIGYISAIALSYVSVWVINSGFNHVISFIRESNTAYTDWAGIYAFFFAILIYTTMYMVVVQQAFNLIYLLPDKVLRWIGGQPESTGAEAAKWADEPKGQIKDAGKDTAAGGGESSKKAVGAISDAASKFTGGGDSGSVEGESDKGDDGKSPPKPPGGGGGAPPSGGGAGGGGAGGAGSGGAAAAGGGGAAAGGGTAAAAASAAPVVVAG